MQRQVKWLGQGVPRTQFTICDANRPCPAGNTCVNGACVPDAFNPTLLRAVTPVQPAAPKKDNTVLWVLGGVIGLGVLYYAVQ